MRASCMACIPVFVAAEYMSSCQGQLSSSMRIILGLGASKLTVTLPPTASLSFLNSLCLSACAALIPYIRFEESYRHGSRVDQMLVACSRSLVACKKRRSF